MSDKKTSVPFIGQDSANNLRALQTRGSVEHKSANGLQALMPAKAELVGNNSNGLAAMAPKSQAQTNQTTTPKKSG